MTSQPTVLLVEDEYLIAADLEQLLGDMGFATVVAANVPAALELVEAGGISFAILDYMVGKVDTMPVGAALRARQIPFALCSGSQVGAIKGVFEGAPFIGKPYTTDGFRAVVTVLVAASAGMPAPDRRVQ